MEKYGLTNRDKLGACRKNQNNYIIFTANNYFISHMKAMFAFLFCLGFAHCFAQLKYPHFNNLGVNEGLSQGNVTCMLQDHIGLMWFGTYSGLNVYDGFKIRSFRETRNLDKSIKGTQINDIVEIDSNRIAIATNLGLNIYYRTADSFCFYKSPKAATLIRILQLTTNTVELLIDQKLFTFTISNKKFVANQSWLQNIWQSFMLKRKNGTNKSEYAFRRPFELFQKYPKIGKLLLKLSEQYAINDIIYLAREQELYLACEEGLFMHAIASNTAPVKVMDQTAKCLAYYDKTLFVGSQHEGLFLFDTKSKKLEAQYQYEANNRSSIGGNFVRAIYLDRSNQLWLSALGNGISYVSLNPKPVQSLLTKNYFTTNDAENKYISAMAEDKQGLLWLCTITGKTFILDSNYKIFKTISADEMDPIGKYIQAHHIFVDSANRILYATNHGLFAIDPNYHIEHISCKDFKDKQESIYYICALSNQEKIMGTRKGILHYDVNTKLLTKDNSFPEAAFTYLYKDKQGKIYTNGTVGGVQIFDYKNHQATKLKTIDGNYTIKHAQEYGDSIWFATTGGILILNKNNYQFRYLDETNQVVNPNIYCLLPDPKTKNTFWCSSNKGIFRYNTTFQNAFALGLNDGLQSLEYNTNAFAIRKNGDFVYGGTDGLVYLNPNKVALNQPSKNLTTLDFKINNKSPYELRLNPTGNMYILPYSYNNLSFRLMLVEFPNTEFEIKYQLEGLEKEWNTGVNPIEIRYPNLRQGKYIFKAKYYDQQKGWVIKELYRITIETPWYKSFWAFLGYIVILGAIVFVIARMYTEKKLEEKRAEQRSNEVLLKERDRISADLHDDIGSTLSSISIYNDLIKTQVNSPTSKINTFSEKISEQIKELMMNTEDIIWSLKIGKQGHQNIDKRIHEYAAELLEIKNIKLHIKISEDTDSKLQHPQLRRNVLMIIKEAMNNASKYSQAKTFSISMTITQNTLLLDISDDGIGFELEKTVLGDGVDNIKNRCASMNGTCTISSKVNQGTQICCRIPIANISTNF